MRCVQTQPPWIFQHPNVRDATAHDSALTGWSSFLWSSVEQVAAQLQLLPRSHFLGANLQHLHPEAFTVTQRRRSRLACLQCPLWLNTDLMATLRAGQGCDQSFTFGISTSSPLRHSPTDLQYLAQPQRSNTGFLLFSYRTVARVQGPQWGPLFLSWNGPQGKAVCKGNQKAT